MITVRSTPPERPAGPDRVHAPRARQVGHWWELLTRTLGGRLVLLVAAVALIGLGTAALGHVVLGAFPSFGEALWSAVAHLVDPGSIGDDRTAAERAVGLLQVIAGIVFFAGVVLTVLTEVVDRALRRLQQGDPAVRRRGHVLVVGCSPSLGEIQRRLHANLGSVPPEIVVMLPFDQAHRRDDARRALDGYPVRTSVVVAEPDDDGYGRVCARDARGVVLLSPEGPADAADLEATDRAMLLAAHVGALGDDAPAVAVELRRSRNAQAFWMLRASPASGLASRFGPNFDAVVVDRNVGALLTLAVSHPAFAAELLDAGDDAVAPVLVAVGDGTGRRYGDVRAERPHDAVLGVVAGTGPSAVATYLPDDGYRLHAEDRLIVAPLPGSTAGEPPTTTAPPELAPSPPGTLLMIGWSDASRALIEDLQASGRDLSGVHLLDRDLPPDVPAAAGAAIRLRPGDPTAPDEIGRAIAEVEPEIVWVAAIAGNEAGAIVSGMLARQRTDVPVLVEQSFAEDARRNARVAAGLTVVSTAAMIAETVALALADPALQAAREQMLGAPGLSLESRIFRGPEPLPLSALATVLACEGAAPLVSTSPSDDPGTLRPGDHVLVLRRVAPVAAAGD